MMQRISKIKENNDKCEPKDVSDNSKVSTEDGETDQSPKHIKTKYIKSTRLQIRASFKMNERRTLE
jgi:hypothetical protein